MRRPEHELESASRLHTLWSGRVASREDNQKALREAKTHLAEMTRSAAEARGLIDEAKHAAARARASGDLEGLVQVLDVIVELQDRELRVLPATAELGRVVDRLARDLGEQSP